MLDGRTHTLIAERAAPLPIEAMVRGKDRHEVADLLPRLFNLCRAAQGMAARLALGIPDTDDVGARRQEILRDHVLRLTMILPGHFGHGPIRLPNGWQAGGSELAETLFGSAKRLPDTSEEFDAYRRSDQGISALFDQVAEMFRADEAVTKALPFVSAQTALDPTTKVENSCAQRVHTHPVVSEIEHLYGRGPFWRVVARAYDLQAILDGAPLLSLSPEPGVAQVSATRGLYAVCAETDGDTVTAFRRVTPTDHLQAKGGVLDQTLASLPGDRTALAPLVMDILDPCTPIRVREAAHA